MLLQAQQESCAGDNGWCRAAPAAPTLTRLLTGGFQFLTVAAVTSVHALATLRAGEDPKPGALADDADPRREDRLSTDGAGRRSRHRQRHPSRGARARRQADRRTGTRTWNRFGVADAVLTCPAISCPTAFDPVIEWHPICEMCVERPRCTHLGAGIRQTRAAAVGYLRTDALETIPPLTAVFSPPGRWGAVFP